MLETHNVTVVLKSIYLFNQGSHIKAKKKIRKHTPILIYMSLYVMHL